VTERRPRKTRNPMRVTRPQPPTPGTAIVAPETVRSEAEEALVQTWKVAEAKMIPAPRFRIDDTMAGCVEPDSTDRDLWAAQLLRALGTADPAAQEKTIALVSQVILEGSVARGGERDMKEARKALNSLLGQMSDVAPRDGIEGMLVGQMVAVNEVALEQLRRAQLSGIPIEQVSECVTRATKLLRLFAQQMDALARNRGRGPSEQRVIVEHVHVYEGGQAVVGAVSGATGTGGGGTIAK